MTNDHRRPLLRRLLRSEEADRVFQRLQDQADERRELSGQGRSLDSRNPVATTADYWPADGSWVPSPEAIVLISDERFQRSYEALDDSLTQHPVASIADASEER